MTSQRNQDMLQFAVEHAGSTTLEAIGELFGDISGERVRQILSRQGYRLPKRAVSRECKRPKCKHIVVGSRSYGGAHAIFCPKHRQPTRRKQSD